MEVMLSRNSGFCFGVQRAVDIALNTAGKTTILGELVHNKDVTRMLEAKGIAAARSIDEISQGNVIIRSHGETDATLAALEDRGLRIIDATCPNVRRVQELAKELERKGFTVIIIGDSDHAEVKGITGNLKAARAIGSAKELGMIKTDEMTAILFQTTQQYEIYPEILENLRKVGSKALIINTLCPVTSDRQKEAGLLAGKADVMIVVGGKNSSNTKRLSDICSALCETHQVENKKELKKEWFQGKKKAGVIGGASTPDTAINEVADEIRKY